MQRAVRGAGLIHHTGAVLGWGFPSAPTRALLRTLRDKLRDKKEGEWARKDWIDPEISAEIQKEEKMEERSKRQ